MTNLGCTDNGGAWIIEVRIREVPLYSLAAILKIAIGITCLKKFTDFSGIPHFYQHGKVKTREKPTKNWLRKHGVCLYRPTETRAKPF